MNARSSRSHCVFTLTVVSTRSTKEGGSMEATGKLHLVDLAGSECAKTAGEQVRSRCRAKHASVSARISISRC